MKIFNSISEFTPEKKTIATLGTFDGVHSGHRKIISRLIHDAASEDCESVILTFFPHPRMVLGSGSDIKLLNTIDEKAMLLRQAGLQNLIIHPFDQAFANLSAEEFVKSILVEKLNIKKIIIGYDHRFGHNRTADINDLIRFGKHFGFEVEQISAKEVNEVAVSSTKIRNAIADGDIELANAYLANPYLLTGVVVQGKQLGRTIGFPTANLAIAESYKQIPKKGVYVVSSRINGTIVYGITNIGTNPTVAGTALTIETFFLNFNGDLYGCEIQLSVLHRLRDEKKFDSVDSLKKQIAEDQIRATQYIAALSPTQKK